MPGDVEAQAESDGTRDQVTPMNQETKEEPWWRAAEEEPVVPGDWGDDGVCEDRGRARGKEETDRAVGMEEWGAAEGLEVCGEGRVMTDREGASGTREPIGPGRTMVLGRAEGVRIQGGADWSTGQGGAEDTEGRGRARKSEPGMLAQLQALALA